MSIFAPGTSDDTHCENCNGGCPGLCTGWAHRLTPEGRYRTCATWQAKHDAAVANLAGVKP